MVINDKLKEIIRDWILNQQLSRFEVFKRLKLRSGHWPTGWEVRRILRNCGVDKEADAIWKVACGNMKEPTYKIRKKIKKEGGVDVDFDKEALRRAKNKRRRSRVSLRLGRY